MKQLWVEAVEGEATLLGFLGRAGKVVGALSF